MVVEVQLHKTLAGYINSSQTSNAGHSKLLLKCQQLFKEVKKYDEKFLII